MILTSLVIICIILLIFWNLSLQNKIKLAKKIQTDLIKTQRLLNNAQEISHIGNWELDLHTDRLYWSDEIYKIFELISENFNANQDVFLNLVHPDDRKQLKATYKSSLNNKNSYDIQHRLLMPNGRIKYVKEQGKTFYDDNGKPLRSTGTVQDITETVKVEKNLMRSQKMEALGNLTGGIAHDYNNMLGVIIGYADLLKMALAEQPKLEKYAEQIRYASLRGTHLTKQLLDFSRKESSNCVKVNLNQTLLNLQTMLEKSLTAKIKLSYDLSENLYPIYLNNTELEDAIVNLCINAKHAMNSKGDLFIKTARIHLDDKKSKQLLVVEADYTSLSIKDTGCGMSEQMLQQIFEPFFTTRGNNGTGLGLSQVHGFVKRYHGAINVYSELNNGTEFTLYFPSLNSETKNIKQLRKTPITLKPDANTDTLTNTVTNTKTNTVKYDGNETVLIVDDEIALVNLSSEILQQHGYTALGAESAERALKILETNSIDLLLTDIIMPEIDGYQLAVIVQKKYPDIKIQFVSGYSGNSHEKIVDTILQKEIIKKPYDSLTLLKKVRSLLDEKDKAISTGKNSIKAFQWAEQFSIGIPEIDDDHKILISLINSCIVMMNKTEKDNVKIYSVLDELVKYTQDHFQREELLMQACRYPEIKKHKQAHQQLIKKLGACINDYRIGKLTPLILFGFLTDWLSKHILETDMAIEPYCNGKNIDINKIFKKL